MSKKKSKRTAPRRAPEERQETEYTEQEIEDIELDAAREMYGEDGDALYYIGWFDR